MNRGYVAAATYPRTEQISGRVRGSGPIEEEPRASRRSPLLLSHEFRQPARLHQVRAPTSGGALHPAQAPAGTASLSTALHVRAGHRKRRLRQDRAPRAMAPGDDEVGHRSVLALAESGRQAAAELLRLSARRAEAPGGPG